MKNIPVLIIGGGPVGPSLSLALSRQNIRSVVIERHSDTTNHPRARGVNVRTMELFKQWGNVTELLKYEQPKEARRIIWAKSLQGEEITRITMDDSTASIYSPTHASLVSQDRVEKSLYHSLLSYNEAEVEFSKECVSFEEDDAGVTVRILDGTNNLVGDAAHRLPLTGGFGMNTGIQDAHNLAWKLAYVINHHISDKLLDTYFEERAPVAEQNIKWSTENATRYDAINAAIRSCDMEKLKEKLHEQSKNLNYSGLDLGFIYHSNAINSESNQTFSITSSEYVPTTLPGSRAPHVKLIKNDKEISTLDLFEKDFVLLVGSEGESWRKSATELIQTLSFPLKIYKVAADRVDSNNKRYGLF